MSDLKTQTVKLDRDDARQLYYISLGPQEKRDGIAKQTIAFSAGPIMVNLDLDEHSRAVGVELIGLEVAP